MVINTEDPAFCFCNIQFKYRALGGGRFSVYNSFDLYYILHLNFVCRQTRLEAANTTNLFRISIEYLVMLCKWCGEDEKRQSFFVILDVML